MTCDRWIQENDRYLAAGKVHYYAGAGGTLCGLSGTKLAPCEIARQVQDRCHQCQQIEEDYVRYDMRRVLLNGGYLARELPDIWLTTETLRANAATHQAETTSGITPHVPTPNLTRADRILQRRTAILALVAERGEIRAREARALFPTAAGETVRSLMARLVIEGLLARHGRNRGTKYTLLAETTANQHGNGHH